jgi:hypothetical protein
LKKIFNLYFLHPVETQQDVFIQVFLSFLQDVTPTVNGDATTEEKAEAAATDTGEGEKKEADKPLVNGDATVEEKTSGKVEAIQKDTKSEEAKEAEPESKTDSLTEPSESVETPPVAAVEEVTTTEDVKEVNKKSSYR